MCVCVRVCVKYVYVCAVYVCAVYVCAVYVCMCVCVSDCVCHVYCAYYNILSQFSPVQKLLQTHWKVAFPSLFIPQSATQLPPSL